MKNFYKEKIFYFDKLIPIKFYENTKKIRYKFIDKNNIEFRFYWDFYNETLENYFIKNNYLKLKNFYLIEKKGEYNNKKYYYYEIIFK